MDKKDAIEFALLKKDVDDLKNQRDGVKKIVCSVIKHTALGAFGFAIASFHYGWFLSEPVRKTILEWMGLSK